MSTQGASSSSSSSSSTPQQSFRNFVVELVLVVWQWMGVWLFRNNEEIERGKSISPELVKEKEESRFVVITLLKKKSYNYGVWIFNMNIFSSFKMV